MVMAMSPQGLGWCSALLGSPLVLCSPALALLGSPGLCWALLRSLPWAPLGSPVLSWALLGSPMAMVIVMVVVMMVMVMVSCGGRDDDGKGDLVLVTVMVMAKVVCRW